MPLAKHAQHDHDEGSPAQGVSSGGRFTKTGREEAPVRSPARRSGNRTEGRSLPVAAGAVLGVTGPQLNNLGVFRLRRVMGLTLTPRRRRVRTRLRRPAFRGSTPPPIYGLAFHNRFANRPAGQSAGRYHPRGVSPLLCRPGWRSKACDISFTELPYRRFNRAVTRRENRATIAAKHGDQSAAGRTRSRRL
jgi:hypothetical protein